jgi:hypothetical protein
MSILDGEIMTKNPRQYLFCKILGFSLCFSALVSSTSSAKAYTGEELSKDAKVTIAEARVIALKAHSGKITDEELETEKGGSGLRYSFDIKDGTKTYEIGVDAKTGVVLEKSAEGNNPD